MREGCSAGCGGPPGVAIKDVLSTFLWLLTTHAYVAWARRPRVGRYLLVMLGLALGLMSKPMLVTLPFTLLLLDYWPLGRLRTRRDLWPRVREKLALLPLVAASGVITVAVQRGGATLGSLERYPIPVRVANAIVSYVGYLGMTIWPRDPSFSTFSIRITSIAVLNLRCWRWLWSPAVPSGFALPVDQRRAGKPR